MKLKKHTCSKKAKNTPFVKIVKFDFIERTVIFLCGDVEKIEPLYKLAVNSDNYAEWKDVEKRIISEENYSGLSFSEHGDGFIYLPEWSDSILVHESYHATKSMLESVGISDEETGACFIEYLYRTVKDAHDTLNKEKKSSV